MLESSDFDFDEKTLLRRAASNNQLIDLTIGATRSSAGVTAAAIEFIGGLVVA